MVIGTSPTILTAHVQVGSLPQIYGWPVPVLWGETLKLLSKRNTATCGHKIDSGISCSIDEGQIFSDGTKAITYGTYCADCMLDYYRLGRIKNPEMIELIELIKNGVASNK